MGGDGVWDLRLPGPEVKVTQSHAVVAALVSPKLPPIGVVGLLVGRQGSCVVLSQQVHVAQLEVDLLEALGSRLVVSRSQLFTLLSSSSSSNGFAVLDIDGGSGELEGVEELVFIVAGGLECRLDEGWLNSVSCIVLSLPCRGGTSPSRCCSGKRRTWRS